MLVLTRKIEQAIVVGSATGFERLLRITVLSIGRGNVRLGIEADACVPVHRGEVWERILTQGQVEVPVEVLKATIAT